MSTQGLVELTVQLEHGNVPDVVVFYDGYNETTAAYSSGRVGGPENYEGLLEYKTNSLKSIARWVARTDLGRMLNPSARAARPPIDAPAVAESVVKTYGSVYRLVLALGREYGFAVHFYWQPQLYRDPKVLTPEEEELVANHPWLPEPGKELVGETYPQARLLAQQQDGITDISHAFTGMTDRIYLGPCHITGAGNRRVAEVMLKSGLLVTVSQRSADAE